MKATGAAASKTSSTAMDEDDGLFVLKKVLINERTMVATFISSYFTGHRDDESNLKTNFRDLLRSSLLSSQPFKDGQHVMMMAAKYATTGVLSTAHRFHSQSLTISQSNMKVQLIPALDDNYMYLLIDEESKECAAVDPVEPQKIMEAVKEGKVKLSQILTTHHHWDHAGGNDKLVNLAGKLEVRGADDRIDGLTHKMKDGDVFKAKTRPFLKIEHWNDWLSDQTSNFSEGAAGEQPAVFTGDTLFVGGCGKFFEGTGQNMYDALVQKLSKLPSDSRVYCGHEYTVSNLKFAAHVEPGNQDLSKKLQWAQSQVKQQKPTIPSTIGEELSYNPFMRVGVESVQKHIGQEDPVSVMGALRQAKNSFRPT